jgi:hypothetical protein
MLDRPLVRRLAVFAFAASGVPVLAAEPSVPADTRRPAHEQLLERAREGAMRKLEQPGCQLLLEEFKDPSGRTLAANLAEWDRTAVDYLRTTPFRDGSFHPLCRGGGSALISVPGMRPVFVCPSFRRQAEKDPWAAENWVIHEMLHTLGLSENPPSSRAITQRVSERCR